MPNHKREPNKSVLFAILYVGWVTLGAFNVLLLPVNFEVPHLAEWGLAWVMDVYHLAWFVFGLALLYGLFKAKRWTVAGLYWYLIIGLAVSWLVALSIVSDPMAYFGEYFRHIALESGSDFQVDPRKIGPYLLIGPSLATVIHLLLGFFFWRGRSYFDGKKLTEKNAYYVPSDKNRKKGMYWMVVPPLLYLSSLICFVIGFAVLGAFVDYPPVVTNLIGLSFAAIAILALVLMIIGIPIGLVYMAKREEKKSAKWDESSGKGKNSAVPEKVKKWNWGAAGFGILWGAHYRVWQAFLYIIPFALNNIAAPQEWKVLFNVVFSTALLFVLGWKGSEWAWQQSKWQSVDQFMKSQKKWELWGAIFVSLWVMLIIAVVPGIFLASESF